MRCIIDSKTCQNKLIHLALKKITFRKTSRPVMIAGEKITKCLLLKRLLQVTIKSSLSMLTSSLVEIHLRIRNW